MGLENRDYIRDRTPGSGFGFRPSGDLWAVKYLLIANVAMFLVQMLSGFPQRDGVTRWLDLRLATSVGPDATPFYELKLEDGRLPREIATPNENTPPTETLAAGTVVESLDLRYGTYRAVVCEGRTGIVPGNSIRPDLLHSWQLIWRILTYGFCHGGLMHLAFNMYSLWLFGRLVEPIHGSREFLFFFLVGVFCSALAHLGMQMVEGSETRAVGASGGVMAVVILTAMTYPREKVLLMLVIPVEFRVLAILIVAGDLFGVVNPVGDGIAHWAHLGGAAFGAAYKYFGWRISGSGSDLINRLRLWRIRRRSKVTLYEPDDTSPPQTIHRNPDMAQRVDELLDKISRHGESSLTDEEREFLAEASRRYRER